MSKWPAVVLIGSLAGGCAAALPGAPAAHVVASAPRVRPRASSALTIALAIPPDGLDAKGLSVSLYLQWLSDRSPDATFTADVSKRSPQCAPAHGARICTATVAVPAGGPYELVATIYSVPPVNGTLPSWERIGGGIRAVDARRDARVALTTSPRLARIELALSPQRLHALDSASVAALVTGVTDGGGTIVSNRFATDTSSVAVALAFDSATRGAMTLSSASVTVPAQGALSIEYDAQKANDAQIVEGFTATLDATASPTGTARGHAQLYALAPSARAVPLPLPSSSPHAIVSGPDGNLWFAENASGRIGSISTALAHLREFAGFDQPQTLANGPDGAIWVANAGGNDIARVATSGSTNFYALEPGASPAGISAGPGSLLWFGSLGGEYVGSIATSGSFGPRAALPPGSSGPSFSVAGPDGNEYVALAGSAQIAQITPGGAIAHLFTVPGNDPLPQQIVVGADANLWFADPRQSALFSMTTSGTFVRYPVPADLAPSGPLAVGPDGKLWFAAGTGAVARLDPFDGNVSAIALAPESMPSGIALGPDGALYLTAGSPAEIVRLQ